MDGYQLLILRYLVRWPPPPPPLLLSRRDRLAIQTDLTRYKRCSPRHPSTTPTTEDTTYYPFTHTSTFPFNRSILRRNKSILAARSANSICISASIYRLPLLSFVGLVEVGGVVFDFDKMLRYAFGVVGWGIS